MSQASLLARADNAIDPASIVRAQVFDLDAIELLKRLPDESIDIVVTDPAYESLEKHRAIGTTTRLKKSAASSNAWFPIFPNTRFPEFFRELYRVMKPNTHVYMYCDQETMFVAKPLGEAAGFKFWKGIVWDKQTMGTGYHYRAQHEMILFFEKGHRNLNSRSISDVIRCSRIRNAYPTEKPVEVSTILIGQSAEWGELVLDPFCGSASVGDAALRLGRRFLGGDIKVADCARERLAALIGSPPASEQSDDAGSRSTVEGRDLPRGFRHTSSGPAREGDAPYAPDVTGGTFSPEARS